MDAMTKAGVEFAAGQIVDITAWTETTPVAIYNKLYDEYWKNCTRRIIVSASPVSDMDHVRDMAAATGAAVVYLDCEKATERLVYQKFLKDMADAPGTSVAMGWYTTEGSGIIACSEFGIGTVPSDLYISSTYYAGVTYNSDPADRTINVPPTPPLPELENKAYIAVYISDGDNVQYVQRYMRRMWDSAEEKASRGIVPVNWTISPSLPDLGPGLLNWYYRQATDKEYFVSGPSGMGYLQAANMQYNSSTETGTRRRNILTDPRYIENYTRLTETYLRLSGLRVITIWDDASPELREAYARNTRFLYGATLQDTSSNIALDVGGGVAGAGNGAAPTLFFSRQKMRYDGVAKRVYEAIRRDIQLWNKEKPLFLSTQSNVWENEGGGPLHTPQIVRMYDDLREEFGDKVEFVRADHFFSLYNEAHGMPFNLCLLAKTVVESAAGETVYDFGQPYTVSRYNITAARDAFGASITVETSVDGAEWALAGQRNVGAFPYIDTDVAPVVARYARVSQENGNIDSIEIYGAGVP
jgi:hypothetical protein